MTLFQITVLIFLAITTIRLFLFRERGNLFKEMYAIRWAFYSLIVGIIIMFPGISVFLSKEFGIQRGVDFIIYVSIIYLLYKMTQLSSEIQETRQKLDKLNRQLALKSHEDFSENSKN